MRFLTRCLLFLNGLLLLFVLLWLLVGGSNRGYFGGGAASEVDGILLMVLALFNVAFLLAVYIAIAPGARQAAEKQAVDVVGQPLLEDTTRTRRILRAWCQWALIINGLLILFTGLWLLISTDRWRSFSGNATQVDMIVLFVLSLLNLAYMGLTYLRFSFPEKQA
jgi:hypothetical protein